MRAEPMVGSPRSPRSARRGAALVALWLSSSLAGAPPVPAHAEEGAAEALPMGGLLRGSEALPQGAREDRGLELRRPGRTPPLAEPGPLFPELMGPLPPQDPPPGIASLSAQTCGACHLEIHRQWQGSTHADAWVDPIFQAALSSAGRPNACIHCHIPLTEQQPQRIIGWVQGDAARPRLEPNPRYLPSLQEEGVTCAACHVRDGVIYGTRTLPDGRAPHPVVAHPDLKRPSLCGSCHQLAITGAEGRPFYDTLGEWGRSTWGKAGTTCQDCHMPWEMAGSTAPRATAAPRRSHLFAGGRDDETVRRAITLLIEPDKASYQPGDTARLTVRLLNTGAGHAVPTTAPFRRMVVRAGPLAEGGRIEATTEVALERRMSPTPPFSELSDQRLAADGEVRLTAEVPIPRDAPAGQLEAAVEVIYQAIPPEVAAAHGLDAAATSRVVLRRVAPLTVR